MPDSQSATVEAGETTLETPGTDAAAGSGRQLSIGTQENITRKLLLCLHELAKSIDSLKQRTTKIENRYRYSSCSVVALEERTGKLEDENTNLREHVLQLQHKLVYLTPLRDEIRDVKQKHTAMEQAIAKLSESVTILEEHAGNSKREDSLLFESVTVLEKRGAKLEDENARLQEQMSRPQQEPVDLTPLRDEIGGIKQEQAALEQSIVSLTRDLEQQRTEITGAQEEPGAREEPEPEETKGEVKEEAKKETVSKKRGLPNFSVRKKEGFCTGMCFSPDNLRAVLLSGKKKNIVLRDLASIPLGGANKLEGMKSALEQLNKKIPLKRGYVHVALSSEDVSFKFLQLPGLSDKQIGQAVEQQMKTEEGWDPSACYLDFHSVGTMGNQTRIFVTYVSRELVTSLLNLLSPFGALVFVVEPDLSALHRAFLFSGMLADNKVAAVINVEPRRGLITLFTERGVILHRSIGRLLEEPAAMIGEEESDGQDAQPPPPAGIVEEFRVDLAVDELVKTFDYYEYSLTGDRIDSVILMGDPSLTAVMGKRITDDVGVNVEPFTMNIDLEVPSEDFDPLIHGTAVGAALSGMSAKRG